MLIWNCKANYFKEKDRWQTKLKQVQTRTNYTGLLCLYKHTVLEVVASANQEFYSWVHIIRLLGREKTPGSASADGSVGEDVYQVYLVSPATQSGNNWSTDSTVKTSNNPLICYIHTEKIIYLCVEGCWCVLLFLMHWGSTVELNGSVGKGPTKIVKQVCVYVYIIVINIAYR